MNQTQILFDFRLPAGTDHLTVKELSAASGYSSQHIERCFDTGKLMGFQSNGASARGQELRKSIRIPRENGTLWLMSIANYDAPLMSQAMREVTDCLPRPLLIDLYAHIGRKLQK